MDSRGFIAAGLDLTCSEKKPSALAVLDDLGEVLTLKPIGLDSQIVSLIGTFPGCTVAIDAPLGLPRDLCCLEESCQCQPAAPQKGRSCERELSRRGIPSYYTTKQSIIKPMVYRAMRLRCQLVARGHTVLEVYPYASKVALFGRPIPKKSISEGMAFLRRHLLTLLPALAPHAPRLDADLCDALIAAYTAHKLHRGEAEGLGDPEEIQIVVPSVAAGGYPARAASAP